MRVIGLLGVTTMVSCVVVAHATGPAAAAADTEIRQVLQQRLDALGRGDAKAYAAFVADEFIGMNGHADRLDKSGLIRDVRPGGGHHLKSTETDVVVRTFGDSAVASYHQSLVGDLPDELAISETYVRENGRWLLAARQEFPVPFAHHPSSKVDPAIYDAYIGDYQVQPGRTVTISREGDKLYERWSGDNGKAEDVPLSETTFVQRGEMSVLVFERDAAGKVTRLVMHFNNHDLVGPKIR